MKRLLFALVFLATTLCGFAQQPPILRNYYSTNANPAISQGGTNAVIAINSERQWVLADNQNYSQWQIQSYLLVTNSAIDGGGLRVSTCIFDRDGVVRVYYAGYTNRLWSAVNSGGHIIGAFGPSFNQLTKHGVVLERGEAGKWDSGNLGGARIFNFGGPTNWLYYFASSNLNFETGWQATGLAFTTDGTNFTRYTSNAPLFDIGATGSFNERANQGGVWVMKHNGQYLMYFSGMDGSSVERVGLAFAPNPWGPWTTNSTNPLLESPNGLAVEPCVLPLPNNRGWQMILGQGTAYSTDLTNWTWASLHGFSDPLNLFFAGGFLDKPLSPFLFYDNGWSALFDDTKYIYLIRPLQTPALIPTQGGALTNIPQSGVSGLAASLDAKASTNDTRTLIHTNVTSQFGGNFKGINFSLNHTNTFIATYYTNGSPVETDDLLTGMWVSVSENGYDYYPLGGAPVYSPAYGVRDPDLLRYTNGTYYVCHTEAAWGATNTAFVHIISSTNLTNWSVVASIPLRPDNGVDNIVSVPNWVVTSSNINIIASCNEGNTNVAIRASLDSSTWGNTNNWTFLGSLKEGTTPIESGNFFVAYSNGLYVAVYNDGPNTYYRRRTSTNLIHWSAASSDLQPMSTDYLGDSENLDFLSDGRLRFYASRGNAEIFKIYAFDSFDAGVTWTNVMLVTFPGQTNVNWSQFAYTPGGPITDTFPATSLNVATPYQYIPRLNANNLNSTNATINDATIAILRTEAIPGVVNITDNDGNGSITLDGTTGEVSGQIGSFAQATITGTIDLGNGVELQADVGGRLEIGGPNTVSASNVIVVAYGGFVSGATNVATIASTSNWTNTLGRNVTAYVTATAVELKNSEDVTLVNFGVVAETLPVHMQPNWFLTGTAIVGTAVAQ